VQTSDRHGVRGHVFVLAGFVAITIVQTWPLAIRLAQVLPHDLGDPVLNTWILWWNAHAVPLTRGWWDAPMFYPARGALAFSETLLGLSLLASPLQWMGASPVVAYNVIVLLSFPLSAWTAYLLAWSLTRRTGPSLVAGVIYGFAIVRFAHLGHIQILWSWWMPLVLLGLHRWMTARRVSGLVLFGVAYLGESLSNAYYFLYFSIIVGLWLAWFTPWRAARGLRGLLTQVLVPVLLPVLLTWAAAAACLAPILLTYARVHHEHRLQRTVDEIEMHSADLGDFFRLPSGTRLLGIEAPDRTEREVALGFVGTLALAAGIAAVLAAAFNARRRARRGHQVSMPASSRSAESSASAFAPAATLPAAASSASASALAFYVLATLTAIVLALGPRPRVDGVEMLHAGPYAWLMAIVPGFTGVRAPARFALLAVLCLAIATALLLARVRLATAMRERSVFGAIAVIALIETWPQPIALPALPPLVDPRVLTPDAAVLELPVSEDQDFFAVYRAMFHRHPLVNGYSGYIPESYGTLRLCLRGQHPYCLTRLRMHGALDVLVDRQHDPGGLWEQFAMQLPDAQVHFQDRQFAIVRLPALPPDADANAAPAPGAR
jgi:hypothetical protein